MINAGLNPQPSITNLDIVRKPDVPLGECWISEATPPFPVISVERRALGTLLAQITQGECLVFGERPPNHYGECPVPAALAIWDGGL